MEIVNDCVDYKGLHFLQINTVPEFSREELANNKEMNISESTRVGDDKEKQTGKWKPSECFLNFGAVRFK